MFKPILDVFTHDHVEELNVAIASHYSIPVSARLSPNGISIVVEAGDRFITAFSADEFVIQENELHRQEKRSQFTDVAIALIDLHSTYVLRF